MLKDFMHGASRVPRGFSLILEPGLRRFVAVPALINAVLFAGLIAVAAMYFDTLMTQLVPEWLGWLEFVLWPLFALTVLVVSYYSFTLVANLIGAPFNERLARAVAHRLGWSDPETGGSGLAGSALRAVIGELRKWLYFAGLALLIVLAWLFPLTTLLTPLLWLVLGAWMVAVEYLDQPLELDGLAFREKRAWLRQRRWQALGFGAAALAATLVPVVNFLVMPAAVAGATVLWFEQSRATP